jgi:sodium/potassium-transporting ATPase subunit alpha
MGVAMGVSGIEVAKEASDMVLMDDNSATVVNAVEEGRTIFSNIKKFIAYVLTSKVPEILPFIAFVVFNAPLALTVVLILSIDLGTDMLSALGLGRELSGAAGCGALRYRKPASFTGLPSLHFLLR